VVVAVHVFMAIGEVGFPRRMILINGMTCIFVKSGIET
jgi:hypothetical protein